MTGRRVGALTVAAGVAVAVLLGGAAAVAAWRAPRSTGSAAATAARLAPVRDVTAQVKGRRASVVWAPARVGGGPVDGYRVVRLPADADSPVAAGGGCAGVLAEAHCVESDVPHGVWRYAVRAVHGVRWQGPRGGPSDPVTVGGPKAPQEAAAADTATAGTATAGTAAVGTAAGQPGTADPGAGGQPANGPTAAPTGEHTGAPSAGTDEPGAGAGRESTGDQVDPNGQTGTATPVDPATTDNQTPSPDSRVIGS